MNIDSAIVIPIPEPANTGMFGGNKMNKFFNAIKSKWVDPMQNQLTEAKYREIAAN